MTELETDQNKRVQFPDSYEEDDSEGYSSCEMVRVTEVSQRGGKILVKASHPSREQALSLHFEWPGGPGQERPPTVGDVIEVSLAVLVF